MRRFSRLGEGVCILANEVAGMKRRLLIAALVVCLTQMGLSPARANVVWTVGCTLVVTFNFSSPVKAANTAPDYTVSVAPAADLDPMWAGSQPCVATFSGTQPGRTTSVIVSDTQTTLWTCGAVVSAGRWEQSWRDQSGTLDPPAVSGRHFLTGTWGSWVMELENLDLSFFGVMGLTVHPDDAGKLATCASGGGFTTLKMIGHEVVQDP